MKQSKNKKNGFIPRLSEKISRRFDIPLEAISDIPTFEIKNDSEIFICGCIGIEKYESDIIILRMKEWPLLILGKELYLHTFADMRLSVYGRINAVVFGKNLRGNLDEIIRYSED